MNKFKQFFREAWELLKDSVVAWFKRDPFRNSTVIAYYTIFSLPGLLVIIINIAGFFLGKEALNNQISAQIEGAIGKNAADSIEKMVANAYVSEGFQLSTIISVATLIFGATGVFYQVQQTLNIVWEVKPQPKKKILKLVRDRLFSFGMVLTIGFLLLVSLILSTAITSLSQWVSDHTFEGITLLFRIIDIALSLAIITFLFAAIFKILPDAEIRWKDVWKGAFFTAVLFVLAKIGLGYYFGISNPGSTYGAAGSIILVMLWTTYSAMLLLLGAEFTRVYAKRYGVRIRPSEYAVSTTHAPDKEEGDFESRISGGKNSEVE